MMAMDALVWSCVWRTMSVSGAALRKLITRWSKSAHILKRLCLSDVLASLWPSVEEVLLVIGLSAAVNTSLDITNSMSAREVKGDEMAVQYFRIATMRLATYRNIWSWPEAFLPPCFALRGQTGPRIQFWCEAEHIVSLVEAEPFWTKPWVQCCSLEMVLVETMCAEL